MIFYVSNFNFTFGSKGYRGNVAQKIQKELYYNTGQVSEKTETIQMCLTVFDLEFGAGKRYVIGDKAYIEAAVIGGPVFMGTNSQMSVSLGKYYKFNPGLVMGGVMVNYKITHWGICFSAMKNINRVDQYGRIKNNALNISLKITKDVSFKF